LDDGIADTSGHDEGAAESTDTMMRLIRPRASAV